MSNTYAPSNLIDEVVAEAGQWFAVRNVSLSYDPSDGVDVTLHVRSCDDAPTGRWRTERGHRLERWAPGRIAVCFDDEAVARTGGVLERRAPEALFTGDLEPGERWVVNFGNPNATKALHVGHLRQLAIGHALSSMHAAAGADVCRQTRVCDYGRSVGEALAGYREHGGDVELGSPLVKGDRYIGDCYARHVHGLEQASPGADASLAREGEQRRDEAERLLAEWAQGRQVAHEFAAMRRWVLDGHEQTMLRLGIVMRRTVLESDYIAHGRALQDRAMEEGLVQRAESGATFYASGDEAYPHLMLCRPDGFPTQHLRYLAVWDGLRDACRGTRTIGVMGSEWSAMGRFGKALLAALRDPSDVHPHVLVVHGMVVAGRDVVKSSRGDNSSLIDEVLDRVGASRWVDRLCRSYPHADREGIAARIVLAHFLDRPFAERASLTLRELLSPRSSIGCPLAAAAVTANDPAFDGPADPDPLDPGYRALVVRSQMHRRLLVRCLERTEVLPLARFHLHSSRWFLEQSPSARLARAMRSLDDAGSTALGLAAPWRRNAEGSVASTADEAWTEAAA